MKLWQKENTSVQALIEDFTVGRDKEFDLLLARYDVEGSIAHVKMLGEVGLMTKEESIAAVSGLEQILSEVDNSTFKIEDGVEDIH
jgi:argininosuccinate lyase